MPYIQTKHTFSNEEVKLYYEDHGNGQPVVLIHGWPLSGEMWEYQLTPLLSKGLRCITYDRRGFGKSSRPLHGYDYDTLADDLKAIIDELQLNDVILVGFSMGGGEVARYISKYNTAKVSKAIFISAVTPFMLKTDDNPEGVDESVFTEMLQSMQNDRIGFLDSFGKQFFGINLLNHPVSSPLLEYYRTIGSFASPIATQECAKAFSQTDFRKDLQKINIPTLIIHGDSDKTVPIDSSGKLTAGLIADSEFIVYENAPHGLFYTHREQLNNDLIRFITGAAPLEIIEDVPPDSVILPSNYPI
ncbi:alpha/beta hydrolase [Danxiaibacter flavus]|uniref:Alpha/beta hydrolase n=1 Tax=Danxiaibacter flavus TaxID=3049108 RepID=A0ABV3ZFY0_9BACT|nr:alpha/beta hydrolase [Chitinophagaceae bacterium DXS]